VVRPLFLTDNYPINYRRLSFDFSRSALVGGGLGRDLILAQAGI
jgi:hypothetical protein